MPRSTSEIIREDIQSTINDRLQKWLSDSLELYKMGGQRYGVALCDMLMAQVMGLLAVARISQLSKEEVLEIVSESYDRYIKQHTEESR